MTKLKKYVVANDVTKEQTNFYKKNIIPIFIFIMLLAIVLSIGYAALNQNLSISGEAFIRVKEDVRITGIASSGSESEGYETYTPEYYKKSLKLYNTLPNAASKITYAGEISNTTSIKYKVSSVTITSTDTNVECTSDLVENAVLPPGKTTFSVISKYKDGTTVDSAKITSVCNVNYEFDIYDFTPPTLTVRFVSKSDLSATFNIVAKDEVGGSGLSNTNIYKYCLSTSSTVASGCTWKNYVSGSDFTDSVSTSGTYYLLIYAVSDNAGNVSSGKVNNDVYYSALAIQLYKSNVTFDYTGAEQIFTAPVNGYYRLETWGAQGGTHTTSIGGYGGYSTGIVKLNKGQILYINVGGTSDSTTGGYNGGGNGLSNVYGTGVGGGGATHIATSTGLLSTLSSNQNSILVVSGGGGGATSYTNGKQYFSGGSGGGMNGVVGSKHQDGTATTAGTQTGGGNFGVGGNATAAWAGGAGGGFYGGTSGKYTAGAGGSGYIANNSLLTYNGVTKHMYCYNCTASDAANTKTYSNGTSSCISETATTDCAKSGNGYAKITLEEEENLLSLGATSTINETTATIKITVTNKTGVDLSSNNIYKYYLSYSKTSLVGGSWKPYTSGISFTETGINTTRYLWVYSISTIDGTINDKLSTTNTQYVIKTIGILPEYTYTGESELIDDEDGNWRIKFITSGTLTFTSLGTSSNAIDVFLVGGGGAGGGSGTGNVGGGGGAGGKTMTYKGDSVEVNKSYSIVIGNGGIGKSGAVGGTGGTSSAFGHSVAGGTGGGITAQSTGGAGGAGGNGGSGGGRGGTNWSDSTGLWGSAGENGASDGGTPTNGGTGQYTTTREFGESTGTLYAGGGGGGGSLNYGAGSGGAGGGGAGGLNTTLPTAGTANLGGGGGGGSQYRSQAGGNGGTGIVIIRNSGIKTEIPVYTYTGESEFVDEGNNRWTLKLLTNGILTVSNNPGQIDMFMVGGGSSLGGGGYTATYKEFLISPNSSYSIIVGEGGTPTSTDGGSSSAFGNTVNGGQGIDGGSGGGGSGYVNDGAKGGTDGGNGGLGGDNWRGGNGQGTTTRAFGEESGELYAGGGGGGLGSGCKKCLPDSSGNMTVDKTSVGAAGGDSTAGNGEGYNGTSSCTNGKPNTGGGAGLGKRGEAKCNGGSGIIILRSAR